MEALDIAITLLSAVPRHSGCRVPEAGSDEPANRPPAASSWPRRRSRLLYTAALAYPIYVTWLA